MLVIFTLCRNRLPSKTPQNADTAPVITNGQPLTSIDKALGLYQALATESELVFDIIRKGKPIEMKINIR